MLNFDSVLRYMLIAVLTWVGVTAVFAQSSMQATMHCIAKGNVVNLAAVARYEMQHPASPQLQNGLSIVVQHENPAINIGNIKPAEAGVLRGAADSVSPSPTPVANFVAQDFDVYTPACPHGAASENYLVSVTKYYLNVQTRSGTLLNHVSLYNFWAAGVPLASEWENRVEYDPATERWIIAGFCDQNTDTAGVLVGISQTDDPTGNWNLYKVPADTSGKTYSFMANLGFNKNWVAVSGSTEAIDSTSSDIASVFVFDKSAMMNDSGTNCTVFKVNNPKTTIAATYDSLIDNLYILAEWSNSLGELQLLSISGNPGAEVLTILAYPTNSIPYGSEAPNEENFAPQLGSTVKFQTGNDEPTSLVYVNGNLWCAQTVFLPSANPTRSSVQWWQIDTTGNVLQLGLIDDSIGGSFYAYPSIAVNQFDDALIGYAAFSAQQYASGGYSYHDHNQSAGITDSPFIYIAGLNTYADTSGGSENEWGYWSATVVDPLDNSGFWTIQSYAASAINSWGAWWADVDNYPTSINNIMPAAPSVQIFPNPNTGTFNLALDGAPNSTVQIKMVDVLGEEVFNTTVHTEGNPTIIPVITQGLSNGIYLAEIYVDGQGTMQKLVIQ